MQEDDLPDDELVRQFKAGDEAAFDVLVRRFQDRVFRLASVWLFDDQSAADVCQEVFVRAYKGLRGFRFRASAFTWLYRTTRNVCHEFNRRRHADTLDHEPEDPGPAAEKVLARDDAARKLRRLVQKLPDRQREVVVLRMFEDLSVRETALAMGCREGTVKALLSKALARLRITLSIYEGDNE